MRSSRRGVRTLCARKLVVCASIAYWNIIGFQLSFTTKQELWVDQSIVFTWQEDLFLEDLFFENCGDSKNFTEFWRGFALIVAQFGMKRLLKSATPRKERNSAFHEGWFPPFSFRTFFRAGFMPYLLNTRPTSRISSILKTSYLSAFTAIALPVNADRTFCRAASCSSTDPPIKMSSATFT